MSASYKNSASGGFSAELLVPVQVESVANSRSSTKKMNTGTAPHARPLTFIVKHLAVWCIDDAGAEQSGALPLGKSMSRIFVYSDRLGYIRISVRKHREIGKTN